MLRPIALALDYAVSQGVLHRELQPDNIIFDGFGGVFLANFGGVLIRSDAMNTPKSTEPFSETLPRYMAPEQVNNQSLSAATHVYGLGVIAYQLLTGRLPFIGQTLEELLVQIRQENPPAPRTIKPDLLIATEEVLLRSLAKDPLNRYQTPGAFISALAAGMQGERDVLSGAALAYKPPLAPDSPIVSTPISQYSPVATTPISQPSRNVPLGRTRYAPTIPAFGNTSPPVFSGGSRDSRSVLPQRLNLFAFTAVAVLLFALAGTILWFNNSRTPLSAAVPDPIVKIVTATPSATLTVAPTAIPTATPLPTSTPIPSPTSIPVPTPIPTPIPFAQPPASCPTTPTASGFYCIDDMALYYSSSHWQHCTGGDGCLKGAALFASSNSWIGTTDTGGVAGDYARLSFTGSQVTIYVVKETYHGYMGLTIDGVDRGKANQYQSYRQGNIAAWTSPPLTPGQHVLQITFLAQTDPGVPKDDICLDAFGIQP